MNVTPWPFSGTCESENYIHGIVEPRGKLGHADISGTLAPLQASLCTHMKNNVLIYCAKVSHGRVNDFVI